MFGLSVMGWERGSTAPRATSSCWAGCRRKEAKAAALGRRDEIFHLAQCQPLCPCAPLTFSGLVLQRTGAPLTAGCTTAPALNLSLVAECMISTGFLGWEEITVSGLLSAWHGLSCKSLAR